MAKTYERLLSTIIPQQKNRASFHPRSQNLSGEDSTWMVDCLKIPRIVHCLFFYYMVDLLWLFQKMSCVLSCERENQIVVTISTFLHHIHVELEVTTPCLLSTVSVRYFLEMRAQGIKCYEKPQQETNLRTVNAQQLFEKGQDLETAVLYNHITGKGPGLVWLLCLSSVDILPFFSLRK